MSEVTAREVEKDSQVKSGLSEAFGAVVDDAVRLLDTLGKALVSTAQDVSNLMVIRVDADTREHLDLLVDAGIAESRSKAAVSLLSDGIQAKQAVFARIRRTQEQIAELRRQARALVEV